MNVIFCFSQKDQLSKVDYSIKDIINYKYITPEPLKFLVNLLATTMIQLKYHFIFLEIFKNKVLGVIGLISVVIL